MILTLYAPYVLIFGVVEEWDWVLVEIWPVFPGMAISALLEASALVEGLRGLGRALLLTVGVLGPALFFAVRFKRAVLPVVATLMMVSLGSVLVIYSLLRA